jgi:squalene-hopene/tetraprenyl-beta-curcumene cyclase
LQANAASQYGFKFLGKVQRDNGSWLPLWFGNQHAHDDENPVYGTSRVLLAYRDCNRLNVEEAQRGAAFLASIQNSDGGWGGAAGIASSVEETALAVEALLAFKPYRLQAFSGIRWLIARVADGSLSEPSPIGFYFAKLWYFERLYPLIFAVSALRRAVEISHYETEI